MDYIKYIPYRDYLRRKDCQLDLNDLQRCCANGCDLDISVTSGLILGMLDALDNLAKENRYLKRKMKYKYIKK